MREDQTGAFLKIGELARQFGINVRTIRFYESIGLLPSPIRTESGYRLYSEQDARRLGFVLQARRVGFSLQEIRQILHLARDGAACSYVQETVARHIAQLDAQIADLQRLRADLWTIAATWRSTGGPVEGQFCGLIERWSSSPRIEQEMTPMASQRRSVEVFTAGCPVCDPVVELVRRIACPGCEVTIHNVRDDPKAAERAKAANIQRLPTVLVDGKPAECCQVGPVTEAGLRAAGVGAG